MKIKELSLLAILFITTTYFSSAQQTERNPGSSEGHETTFTLGESEFLLNGKPYQIRAGEIHPNRIPKEYWRHRIQMAKAMGLNTIASYVFWNYFEEEEGKFDFNTGNRDLTTFIKIVAEEGMWLFLRPGPYCCAEWDFGALPPYLLKYPDIKIRCMDPRYTGAVERYITELAKIIRPYQLTAGGPLIMLQIENEYGSYGNDKEYLQWLAGLWRENGIDIPFCTGDGPTPYMLDAGTLPGCAVGLDSGSETAHWDLATMIHPGVPVFSSETYPGWLTHWGEEWATVSTDDICREVNFLMENNKSFNLYVFHGGTNFGFTAGANAFAAKDLPPGITHNFMPDVTSYDYNAPLTEQGKTTDKYLELRKLIQKYLPNERFPVIPAEIPTMTVPPVTMAKHTSLWDNLPQPKLVPQPLPIEYLGQYHGMILYRTRLIGHKSGKLTLREVHDYALVFVEGKYIGTIDRRLNQNSIEIPVTGAKNPLLEILVEEMGHINFAEFMIDRKGITDRAVLNGMTLMNWEVYNLPLEEQWVASLAKNENETGKPVIFFKGSFDLDNTADTYIDLSNYQKGIVWINGNNLGRYWNIGPQKRLYCPAGWLKKGKNEIIVLDLHQINPATVWGEEELN